MKKSLIASILVIIALSSVFATGTAENEKSLPDIVEIYVPASAGGGTDVMARTLANQIALDSEIDITVVNNVEQGGIAALEIVRNAAPDGSVIMQTHSGAQLWTANGIYDHSIPDEFTVIVAALTADQATYTLVSSTSLEYQTLPDLIRYAEANPGKVRFGVDVGSTSHVLSGMFANAAGIEIQYVSAGSDTNKLKALENGEIDACFVNANQAKQYVDASIVNALAVVARESTGGRSEVMRYVPCLQEYGYDVSFATVNFIIGPKGMDPGLVTLIHDSYVEAYGKTFNYLEPRGFGMEFLTEEDGLAQLKSDQAKYNKIAAEIGLN